MDFMDKSVVFMGNVDLELTSWYNYGIAQGIRLEKGLPIQPVLWIYGYTDCAGIADYICREYNRLEQTDYHKWMQWLEDYVTQEL